MTVLGTGVAAGVAQTPLQAREVAQHRARQKAQADADAERLRELVELQLRTVDDADRPDGPIRRRIDEHPPQRPPEQPETPARQPATAESDHDGGIEHAGPTAAPARPHAALYRHLDVQA